ncbi:MAG: hypothetical protein AB7P04_07640 [Bacteriovoracia bacterium]
MKHSRFALVAALAAGLFGCMKKKDGAFALENSSQALAIEAFHASVYQLARRDCVGCHGINQAPLFVTNNVAASYQAAKNYTSFAAIPSSRLVAKAKDGHCGPACSTDGSEMTANIQAWWDNGEGRVSQAPTVGLYETSQLPIPANLPTASFVKMEWALDNLHPYFAGMRFEIEIKRFSAGGPGSGSYQIRKPRLATRDVAIHIADVKLLLNGQYEPVYSTYTTIDRTVNPAPIVQPYKHPVLSSSNLIMIQDADEDYLSIAFGTLEIMPNVSCVNLAGFVASVKPVMQANCFGCHNAAHRFPMNGQTDAALCANSMQRINPDVPMVSPLVQYPVNGTNDHSANFNEALFQPWVGWMQSED